MRIDAHIIAYNEAEIIKQVVDYYRAFCGMVYIYDNYSEDDTRAIAQRAGAEVKYFGIPNVLDDGEYLKVKNHCWKGSKADFVIVGDTDEILYHPEGILPVLERNHRSTMFKTQGFEIFSREVPRETLMTCRKGCLNDNYSKSIIFSPRLKEIDYVYGCHVAKPKGNVIYGVDKFAVLHYRSIGGPERLVARHKANWKRMSPRNLRHGLGHHYETPDEQKKIKEWEDSYAQRVELSQAGIWSPRPAIAN